jgi:ATP-dependent DNA ligase
VGLREQRWIGTRSAYEAAATLRDMDLPVMPPVQPMLAKSVKGVPDPRKHEGGLSFEPKWDGF